LPARGLSGGEHGLEGRDPRGGGGTKGYRKGGGVKFKPPAQRRGKEADGFVNGGFSSGIQGGES